MINELPIVDSVYIPTEKRDDIQRLSALGYQPCDIAIAICLDQEDVDLFVYDSKIPGTTVYALIQNGIIITRAAPEAKLHEAAEAGNVDAIKELDVVRRRHVFEKLITDMDNDEYC